MLSRFLFSGALLVASAGASLADAPNISCEQIGAAIGAPITAMKPDPSTEPAWIDNPDAYQIICSWVTEPALKMMQGSMPSDAELGDVGQISAQLFVHKDLKEVGELRSNAPKHPLPASINDPDSWVFAIGALDYDDIAGPMPPELYKAELSTTISTLPLFMEMPKSFQSLTKGWSVQAGLRVIEMVEDQGK